GRVGRQEGLVLYPVGPRPAGRLPDPSRQLDVVLDLPLHGTVHPLLRIAVGPLPRLGLTLGILLLLLEVPVPFLGLALLLAGVDRLLLLRGLAAPEDLADLAGGQEAEEQLLGPAVSGHEILEQVAGVLGVGPGAEVAPLPQLPLQLPEHGR